MDVCVDVRAQEGIFNDNWRIRQSSCKLLGKLLFKASLRVAGGRLGVGGWDLVPQGACPRPRCTHHSPRP